MKIRLLWIAAVLVLILGVAVPAVALAAKPTSVPFLAYVFPGEVSSSEEIDLGESGRVLAKEYLDGGKILYSNWSLLSEATVEIYTKTIYVEYPTGEREGTMSGRMIITHSTEAGTLELVYTSRISGLGGYTFDGRWTAVKKTGVFKGIHARGTFFCDPEKGVPPTLSGVYWANGKRG